MEQKVRIRITTVRRRTVRVTAGGLMRATCPACGREVETLARGQASEVLEVGEEELNEFIAAGRVHAIRTVSGSVRVCKDSLF